MKKYKILKPYPGSEYLGEKIEEWTIPYNIRYDPLFSQYYEEVVEKDYEILSIIPDSITNGIIFKHNCPEIESYLKYGDYNIHSVKRLLDGEVLTVGDKSNINKNGKLYHNKIWYDPHFINTNLSKKVLIKEFKIIDNIMTVNTDYNSCHTTLNSLSVIKKPLFTTEDGVDVFEGDEYWNVNVLFNIKHIPNCYNFRTEKEYVLFNSLNNNNCFSTRTAAEEYVLMNKPCLSINNVMSVTYNPTESKTSTTYKLIKLVQKSMENGKD